MIRYNLNLDMIARSARPTPPLPAASTADPALAGLAGPALRTFFSVARAWTLSNDECITLLGEPRRSTYFEWKRAMDGRRARDTLERISYVLGIYKALQILLPDPAAADAWVRKPNDGPLFGGRPALARLLSGNVADLYVVRQYLDAIRGGG